MKESKHNPYNPIPQELRKQIELTQRLTKHIPPILETQERIKAMVMPLERLSAINSQIMNCQIPAHSGLNPTVIVAAEMARQAEGTLTAALDTAQSPTVMAATEVTTRFAEPMGLAALQMTNLQLDTAALQFANIPLHQGRNQAYQEEMERFGDRTLFQKGTWPDS